MPPFDTRTRLTRSGDSLRLMVQRVSELSLLALHELALALLEQSGGAGSGAEAGGSIAGFDLPTLRSTLQDASGSSFLADIRARHKEGERPSDEVDERDQLIDGVLEAAGSGRSDEAGVLLAALLQRFPGDPLVAVTAGCVRWSMGDLAGARQDFVRAQSPIAGAGLKADALFLQAVVSAELGEVDLAFNLLSRCAVTEESLPESWTRPAGRARWEQARLVARRAGDGALSGELAERCRQALGQAVEANGYFFGPAYVDPTFGSLAGFRDELRERFDATSLDAHLVANAGNAYVREIGGTRLVDDQALQRARDVFSAPGYFSRSRLRAVGVRAVAALRDAATDEVRKRVAQVVATRDAEVSAAESALERGQQVAEVELARGAESTRALDMRAFALRESTAGRFKMSEPLEAQYGRFVDESRTARNKRLLPIAVAAPILAALAVLLVPSIPGKIGSAVVLAALAGGLAFRVMRRHQAALAQLDKELADARGVKTMEESLAVSSQQTEAHSHAQAQTARRQAEGERQVRLARATERFQHDLDDARRRLEAVRQASDRFFRAIDGGSLPEARFDAPNVDELAAKNPAR